jgi:hypothetical protein
MTRAAFVVSQDGTRSLLITWDLKTVTPYSTNFADCLLSLGLGVEFNDCEGRSLGIPNNCESSYFRNIAGWNDHSCSQVGRLLSQTIAVTHSKIDHPVR